MAELFAAGISIGIGLALIDDGVEQALTTSRRPALQGHGVEPESDEDRSNQWWMEDDLAVFRVEFPTASLAPG